MWSLLLLLGYVLTRGTGSATWPATAPVVGLVQTALGSWNSDKIAVCSVGAIEVIEAQQPQMYAIVYKLSTAADQPVPRFYVAPTMSPNAFVINRSPSHTAVCCMQGILQSLNERKLCGVLGHELFHVYSHNALTFSVAAGIAGVISSMVTITTWLDGGNRRDRDDGSTIAVLPLSLLTSLAATIIRFTISRTHEYDADHDGAEFARNPLVLASAFSKLESGIPRVLIGQDLRPELVSSMMTANSLRSLHNLFATHLPMDKRTARLEQMARYRQCH